MMNMPPSINHIFPPFKDSDKKVNHKLSTSGSVSPLFPPPVFLKKKKASPRFDRGKKIPPLNRHTSAVVSSLPGGVWDRSRPSTFAQQLLLVFGGRKTLGVAQLRPGSVLVNLAVSGVDGETWWLVVVGKGRGGRYIHVYIYIDTYPLKGKNKSIQKMMQTTTFLTSENWQCENSKSSV